MSLTILYLGIILSILIRLFFISHGSDVADISLLHQMGESLLKRNNPYTSLNFNAYPPVGIYIEAIILYISQLSHVPFYLLTKILPNIADIAMGIILYIYLVKQKIKHTTAVWWSLALLLNPISIIISSIHGQIDSMPSLLVLLAIYLNIFKSKKSYFYWSALSLGLAISIKPNPLILLPIFILFGKTNLKEKIIFLLLAVMPISLSLIPFILENPTQIIGNLLTYSGIYDFSYAAIFRGIWYQKNANFWLPLTKEFFDTTKVLFLSGIVFTSILFARTRNIGKGCLTIYLLFFSIYFGIGAQYLSWILPLAILEMDLMIIPFSIAGIFALLGFYLFFGPNILFGSLTSFLAFQSKFMPLYVFGNLALWIITIWWLIKIIKNYLKANLKTFDSNYKRLILFSLIICIIFAIPLFRLLILMSSQLFR